MTVNPLDYSPTILDLQRAADARGEDGPIEPHIWPLVERLSGYPGIKTWQSCEGHQDNEGSIRSAHVWVTPVLPSCALECLAAVPGIDEVAVLYGREIRPIVQVTFVGGHWRSEFKGACQAVVAAWSQISVSDQPPEPDT